MALIVTFHAFNLRSVLHAVVHTERLLAELRFAYSICLACFASQNNFYENSKLLMQYVRDGLPVVISGLTTHWPALEFMDEPDGTPLEALPTEIAFIRVFFRALRWSLLSKPKFRPPQAHQCLAHSLSMDLNSSPENVYIREIIQSSYVSPVGLDQDFFRLCAAYNTSLARRWVTTLVAMLPDEVSNEP